MLTNWRSLVVAIALTAAGPEAWGDQIAMVSPEDPGAAPSILEGKPAHPTDWPMTRLFSVGNRGCTGTAIGAQTILTAAHCLGDGPNATFESSGRAIAVTCIAYPNWKDAWPEPITSYDIALCRADETIKMSDSQRYERVSLTEELLTHGQSITLLGYGCTETKPSLTVLYTGAGTIDGGDFGAYAKTASSTGAQLCPGDSGGAAYVVEDTSRRHIAAIASRGNRNQSWLTRLSDPHVSQFLKEWAAVMPVCGLNAPDGQCHD